MSDDFTPKKAYYEMAQVNQPLVPLFRIAKKGQSMDVWVANDLESAVNDCAVTWTVAAGGNTLVQGTKRATAVGLSATLVQTVDRSSIPPSAAVVTISLTLTDAAGRTLSRYRRDVFLKAWRLQDAVFTKG